MFNFKQKQETNATKENVSIKEDELDNAIGTLLNERDNNSEKDANDSTITTTSEIGNDNELNEFRSREQDKKIAEENDDYGIGILTNDSYGPLLPYIKDENVTDINWNGHQLWIDDLNRGRYVAPEHLSDKFVNQFATLVSNVVSESFNKYNPRLEAEAEDLRISILNKSIAHTGTSISIRKTPAIKRISFQNEIKNGTYCSEEMANFMSNSVKANMNIIICGLPGDGKTELLKYLTSYIPPKDRVITIEDNLEIHYHDINPGKDCVEMKINEDSFTYVDAIKTSLRQFPKWIMLSEARSKEVKYLLEAMSAGPHCITTIHTDDTRKIPSRIKNMAKDMGEGEGFENDIYSFINIGILIRKKYNSDGTITRYLSQMAAFDDSKNEVVLIFDNGERTQNAIPENIMKKFNNAGIKNPFEYVKMPW